MSTWDEFTKVVVQKPDESSQFSQAAMDQVRDSSAISCPKLVWVAQKSRIHVLPGSRRIVTCKKAIAAIVSLNL
jgi:hypothetical protein